MHGYRAATVLDVQALPRRTAHAVHALLACSDIVQGGTSRIPTAAEVCVWDSGEAYTPRHTAKALQQAQRLGLAVYVPRGAGYWIPTPLAYDHKRALEDRFLADTADP